MADVGGLGTGQFDRIERTLLVLTHFAKLRRLITTLDCRERRDAINVAHLSVVSRENLQCLALMIFPCLSTLSPPSD